MTFASPIWLLGLLPVAAVAVMVFVRPAQPEVLVGSLALWHKAAAGLGGGAVRSARRIPRGWVLLLVGAVLAVLGTARPTWQRETREPEKPAVKKTPAITFDALAGETHPDGKAEIFLRLGNHTQQSFRGSLTITPANAARRQEMSISIPPAGTFQTIPIVPDSPTLAVRVNNDAGETIASADLRKSQPGLTRVATMGQVGKALQRYIQSDARLEWVPSPAEADVILAQDLDPPNNTAALLLAPPTSPAGWQMGERKFAVTLASADVAAGDPIMKDVNVAAMAVRRLQPWRLVDGTTLKPLLQMDGNALILRTTPERDPSGTTPRRVYVAFAITVDNTNIDNAPGAFLTLLAGAIRWLHPTNGPRGIYVCDTRNDETYSWHLQERAGSKRHSVLVGAIGDNVPAPTSEKTRWKVPPSQTRWTTPQPENQFAAVVELRTWFIVAAMLCWILGWRRAAGPV